MMTQDTLPDHQNLPDDLKSLQQELLHLQNDNTCQRMFDNVYNKKERMIIECNLILEALIKQENQNTAAQLALFDQLIEKMREIISLIDKLDETTEAEFQKHLEELNRQIEAFNDHNKLHQKISTLHYGKNLFTAADNLDNFLKVGIMLLMAWHSGMKIAISHVQHVFHPIHVLFLSLTILSNVIARTIEFFRVKRSNAALQERDAIREQEIKDSESLLKTSIIFKSLVFILHVLSTLAFAGIITTPLGLDFLAAASLVLWLDETFIEDKKNENTLKKFKALADSGQLTETDREELVLLQKEIAETHREATWKALNVLAAILIACGPIPVAGPIIGLVGLSMLAIAPARVLYKQAQQAKSKSEAAWKMTASTSAILIGCVFIPTVGPILGLTGILLLGVVSLKYAGDIIKAHIKDYILAKKPITPDTADAVDTAPVTKSRKNTRHSSYTSIPFAASHPNSNSNNPSNITTTSNNVIKHTLFPPAAKPTSTGKKPRLAEEKTHQKKTGGSRGTI